MHDSSFKKHIKFDEHDGTLFIQVGKKKEGEPVDWTQYTANEAKEALKKMNAKKGPKFDILATPTRRQVEREGGEGREKRSTGPRPRKPNGGWIPPARGAGPSSTSLPEDDDAMV